MVLRHAALQAPASSALASARRWPPSNTPLACTTCAVVLVGLSAVTNVSPDDSGASGPGAPAASSAPSSSALAKPRISISPT